MHLCSVLYTMNNMCRLIVDGNWMSIITVIVKDDASKLRTASMYLNWKLTWQHS